MYSNNKKEIYIFFPQYQGTGFMHYGAKKFYQMVKDI